MVPIDGGEVIPAEVVWEEIACPLCAAEDEEPVLVVPAGTGSDIYRMVRCRRCGMVYLNPRPDAPSIGRFYPPDYEEYQAPQRSPSGWWGRVREWMERLALSHAYGYPPPLAHWYEKALARALGLWLLPRAESLTNLRYHGQGRLLDFGCGSGWYAHRMQQRGWQVTGLDFSTHAARQVTRRFGIPVLVGSLPHPGVADETYDVITMGCVLEHVHDPHQVIDGAGRALRPGGQLLIVVPNLDSWGFRYFGPDWWPLELPRHLLHFTPVTLRRLVEMHGLQVCEQDMLMRGGWMRRSLAISRRRPSGSPGRRLLAQLGRVRMVPRLLARWAVWTGQADCIMVVARRPGAAQPGRAPQAA